MPSTIRRLALTFFSDARLLYTQHASPFHLVMYARMNIYRRIPFLLLYPSFTWRVRPYRMGLHTRNDFGNTSSADDSFFSLSFATSWRGRYSTCVCVRIDPLSFVSLSIMMPENPLFLSVIRRISATHVWRRSWSSPYRASWICSLYRIDDGRWYKVCFIYIYSVAQESDSLSHLTNNDLFSFWILYYILSLLIWKTQRGSDLPLDKHCCNVNGFFPSLCKDCD